MGRSILILSVALMWSLLASEAHARISTSNTDRVVAIVSGSVITQQELDNRFELTRRQINQAIPENQRDAIYRKILNDLINEEVQRQFAKGNNIVVEDSEVDLAIAEIEKRNGWKTGTFYTIAKDVEESAKSKIKSDIVRQKIVTRRLRSRVAISKGEIDRLIENLSNRNNTEKKIQQVFISYDKKEQSASAKKEIYKIYNQMKNSTVEFSEFAKSLSGSSSFKKNVDDLGWFATGELTPVLDKALQRLNIGEMSEPLLTTNGWHILYVEDMREPEKFSTEPIDEYDLFKISMKINSSDRLNDQKSDFEDMVKKFKTLGDAEEAMLRQKDNNRYAESGSLGWVKEQNLPRFIKDDIQDMDINDFTDVTEHDGHLVVYLLNDQREVLPEKLQEYRNRIRGRLMNNRLDLAARRFMRDLRRQAYIEVRL